MVLTDYLQNYGEMFFHILSKQRREAIEVILIYIETLYRMIMKLQLIDQTF